MMLQGEKAKPEGSLNRFSAAGAERRASAVILAEILAGGVVMIRVGLLLGAAAAAAGLLSMAYYRRMSLKEFGGITGDLAGWFICVCETAMVCAIAAAGYMTGI